MDSYLWIAIAAVFLVFFVMKRRGQVSLDEAKAFLREGAVILDVRSPQEYAGGAIAGSVNVPLNGVVQGVRKQYPDKNTILLCHCASGARSASAVNQLKAAGYENAYNLGGYGRAAKLVA